MDEMKAQEASIVPAVENEKSSTERMIPQSEVDKLVYGVKREAYEKGHREAKLAEEAKTAQLGQSAQQSSAGQSLGGMQQLSPEQLRQMIVEEGQKEAQKRAHEERAMRFANNFIAKLESGKSKYDSKDFEKTLQDLDLQTIPEVLELTDGIDNAADVVYHLGKNPMKLGSLSMLAYKNPKLALSQMHELSESLKNNESASNLPPINEPLSQIRRSSVGVNNGNQTISDLRRLSAFKV